MANTYQSFTVLDGRPCPGRPGNSRLVPGRYGFIIESRRNGDTTAPPLDRFGRSGVGRGPCLQASRPRFPLRHHWCIGR
jgi:hypothetical protein